MGFFGTLIGRQPHPDPAALRAAGAKVIDVRSRDEYRAGHIAGARNMDVGAADFSRNVARLSPAHTYVVYCQSGSRSGRAASMMQSAGLRVVNGGGIGRMQHDGWTLGA